MIDRRFRRSVLMATLCTVLLTGCGHWFGGAEEEVAEDVSSENESHTAPAEPEVRTERGEQKLTLNLKVGDRFPLLKTVEQDLRQPSAKGWTTSHSRLEMLLSITLEEIYRGDPNARPKDPRDGEKRFEVRYHRVLFSQDLPGHKVDYDSSNPPQRVPLEAQAYHGLKDNGFQFWIGADNQILDVIGFKAFMERCLKEVAPEKRQQAWNAVAASSGADGIANFVDDSIGLLPKYAVKKDDTWNSTRSIIQPVPMHLASRYTLRHISPEIAEIDILGTISPSASYGPNEDANREVAVSVKGGHCYGSCVIDRRTGLPITSKVEQVMHMHVRLAGGLEFEQDKTTITTIGAFPEQGAGQVAAAPGASGAPVANGRPIQVERPVQRAASVGANAPR